MGDNLGALGWAADAAVAGTAIAAWGDKLGKGTLDKSDPTWSAYKKWLEKDVCTSDSEDAEYNGYPAFGFNTAMPIWDVSISSSGDYIGYMYQSGSKKPTVGYMSKSPDTVITYGDGLTAKLDTSFMYNGKQYWYTELLVSGVTAGTYNNFIGKSANISLTDIRTIVASWLDTGVLPWGDTGEKEYTYVGGLAPSLGGAGVLEGDWDVVGVGEAEDEKETKLPWVGSPDLDHTISDVVSGEKTWTDVLDQVGVGVIDRTEEGDKVIDEDGVTTKDWVYAPAGVTTPDITIPDTGTVEPSKELSGYTLAGLEKIFPFCLPFDLIDFVNVLDAPAEAPHFKYAFPYPTLSGMQTYEIDIDLSPFDSVAELLRDMECLLFIVGLILITRSAMIRG